MILIAQFTTTETDHKIVLTLIAITFPGAPCSLSQHHLLFGQVQMEWIWNYVFALLTSHSITQMDSCRHGCWAKLVTLSPNNIAITKSHSNYGHIGIFIGAWAWQPKQCPLGESGLFGSLCLTMALSPPLTSQDHVSDGVRWTSCVPAIAPGPGLCLLSPHNGGTRINVRSFSQQSPPSDMNHIPLTGQAASSSVSSVENQMGNCLSSCPRRVRDK